MVLKCFEWFQTIGNFSLASHGFTSLHIISHHIFSKGLSLQQNIVYQNMVFRLASGVVEIGDFTVELASLLSGGLSHRAYGSVDIQSDSDCCKKLNPGFLQGHCVVQNPHTRSYKHTIIYRYIWFMIVFFHVLS